MFNQHSSEKTSPLTTIELVLLRRKKNIHKNNMNSKSSKTDTKKK